MNPKHIAGDVTGQVAHSIQNFGPVCVAPQDRPESGRQADFFRAVGIWCPRDAREELERLMEHEAFTAPELALAWRSGALQWDIDEARLRVSTPLFEAISAWVMHAMSVVYFLLSVLPAIFLEESNLKLWAVAGIGAAIVICASTMSSRFFLKPRRVGMRVQRVLLRKMPSPALGEIRF